MSKLRWRIIHECDDEEGNPVQWSAEINHKKYGKYCWINDMGDYFNVEVNYGGFIELVQCKSLASAKRWVATQLIKRNNDMKVFYLAQENFGCVVYAGNKNDAFEKMKCKRKELLESLGLPLDITRWGIEEFTPDLYDGVLCFY